VILAVLASLLLWPLYLGLFIPLALLGVPLLAVLSLFRAWRYRLSQFPQFNETRNQYPLAAWLGGRWTWLWGNEEDGVDGPDWWRDRMGIVPVVGKLSLRQRLVRSWAAYRWSAFRNPVNNLRFIPYLNPVIVPTRIRHKLWGSNGAAFTWQGPYAGLLMFPVIRGRVFRFWLGWKLKPADAQGVAPDDMRRVRCGFAIQFKAIGD
jgi:hypothetical protein